MVRNRLSSIKMKNLQVHWILLGIMALALLYSMNRSLIFVTTFIFHAAPKVTTPRPSTIPRSEGLVHNGKISSQTEFQDHKAWLMQSITDNLALKAETIWPKFPRRLVGRLLNKSNHEILCAFKDLPPISLTRLQFPFNVNPTGKLFPQEDRILPDKRFRSCALVSNSGRMLGAKLGAEIDAHDQVLRMNAAPVRNYESDVGNKTTIRMLNNFEIYALDKLQRISEPTLTPMEMADSKDATFIGWDACPDRRQYHHCSVDIETAQIRKDAQDTLQPFFTWRSKNPKREFYFIDPEWVWDLAELLQELSPFPLETNVPSSGFLSFVFLLHYCEEVHTYEMIPSKRAREKRPCHYFRHYAEIKRRSDDDFHCTFIRGHQSEIELLTYLRLNSAPDSEVFGKGYAVIKGLADLKC